MWRSKICKYHFTCTEMKSFLFNQVKVICVCLHLSVLHFNVEHAEVLFILVLIWEKILSLVTHKKACIIWIPGKNLLTNLRFVLSYYCTCSELILFSRILKLLPTYCSLLFLCRFAALENELYDLQLFLWNPLTEQHCHVS